MRYMNKVTGAVIETDCLISGGDWEACEQVKQPAKNAGSKRGKKSEPDVKPDTEPDAEPSAEPDAAGSNDEA